ncbi:MAG: BamA/TamA family outer membrane protein [Bacteroidetes bacterium]|nr:BamA/TamA family outer membrane protein [Bacteroidota bacterium]
MLFFFFSKNSCAQVFEPTFNTKTDSSFRGKKYHLFSFDEANQTDIKDVARSVLKKGARKVPESFEHVPGKLHISPLLAPTYTIQTGYGALIGSEIAFYTDSSANQNISSILTSLNYTQYRQTVLPVEASFWSRNNKYNYQVDWRYLNYPSMTYGLGGGTPLSQGYSLDYYSLRLHQSVFRSVAKNMLVGLGYDYDHIWDIHELNAQNGDSVGGKTDYDQYGFSKTATASGISIGFLYDSRRNSINPNQGSYLNVSFRPKFKFLGSNESWQSLFAEFKHYEKFPKNTNNVIAFWSYNWLTVSGNPPYLLLPSTGWDTYWNTGRGYIQGRYRSKNMIYLETEYRFAITPDGLFSGVAFINAGTYSEKITNNFEYISPGYGLGLRIKLDKFSKTNFCIDYGWGLPGNRGFALNIGEVF